MIKMQRLKSINELSRGDWCEGGMAAEKYAKVLGTFTDDFPSKQEALRDAIAAGDTAAATGAITDIRDMLFRIGADKLAADCTEKIAGIPDMNATALEAYAENFLSTVSSLSVDVQMAIYGEEHTGDTQSRKADTSGQGAVILAVDDNAFFLNTIKSYLQDSPYKLTCVNSGSTALRFLEKHTPDLCILDIDMPEMDGYELAGRIRGIGITAPIIFLTGNASKDYVIKAVKAGAADFIIKPISKEQALSKIAKYV